MENNRDKARVNIEHGNPQSWAEVGTQGYLFLLCVLQYCQNIKNLLLSQRCRPSEADK